MPLPTIEAPTYTFTLPDSKKKIKFRPFRVKEEKVLLLASESGDLNTIYQAVHDITLSCTNGKLNIFNESSLDSEYALIKLRSASIGDTVKPDMICSHCEAKNAVKIKSDEFVIDRENEKENKIKVNETMMLELKYPSFVEDIRNSTLEDQVDLVFNSVRSAINKIYYDDEVFDTSEYKEQEIDDFVNNLDTDTFKKILDFVNGKPKVKIPVKFVCSSCEKENEYLLEGMDSFFD